jgi:hypothetical protein
MVFNRPFVTQTVFETIRKQRPKKMYVAADGPRLNISGEAEKCMHVQSIVREVDWDCKVHFLFRTDNLGCGRAVSEALQWFFENEEAGIILEDDCLPNPEFFLFTNEMTGRFKENKKILSVNGCNLGFNNQLNKSYIFSRYMNMWGWATWADRAKQIDYTLSEWRRNKKSLWHLYKYMRSHLLDADIHWYKYWQHNFDSVAADNNITWDWQWIHYQISNYMLSVVPAKNLVTNLGFNNDATHTTAMDNLCSHLNVECLHFPLIHPNKIIVNHFYEENFVKWVWCYHKRLPLPFYLKRALKNTFYRQS